jgi:DNA-binding transcriptional regulator YiaG
MKRLEMSEAEILAVANSIMDNLMQAPTDIDHERHVRDFIEQLKAIVTKESLEAQHKEYQAKLGNFSEREFVAVYRKETDAAAFWKQKYTKPNGEHIAFLRLISINGKNLVQNVSVTSQELIRPSTRAMKSGASITSLFIAAYFER